MIAAIRSAFFAIHFLLASLAGLAIRICRPFNPDNSRLCGRLYAWGAKWLLGMQIEADRRVLDAIPPGAVFVSNHQSNFDLFILGAIVPDRTVSMGKKSLRWIPLFGQLYWLAGNVLVDRGNAFKARNTLQDAVRTLRDKRTSIWIFPEGTRNSRATLAPFKKGAFQMAIAAGVPVIPVCISPYRQALRWGSWRPVPICVRVLPPIDTSGLTKKDTADLALECQRQMKNCFEGISPHARS